MKGGKSTAFVLIILSTIAPPLLRDAISAEEQNGNVWVLEHFSDDVTILRATILHPSSSVKASLTLSCEGRKQLFRLALVGNAGASLGSAANGFVLMREGGLPTSSEPFVVARYKRPNTNTLVVSGRSDDTTGGSVVAIARLMARQSKGLEFLIHPGQGMITLSGLRALHLPLPSSSQGAAAFRDFIAVCSREFVETEERGPPRTRPSPRP